MCGQCMVRAKEGVFCSEDCLQNFVRYHQQQLPTIRGPGCLYRALQAIILLAVIAGILYALARWGQVDALREMFRKIGMNM
jgi:hypothetical protein